MLRTMSDSPIQLGIIWSTVRQLNSLTDVHFRVSDHSDESYELSIFAHKNILAEASPVFHAQFYPAAPRTDDTVFIHDTSHEAFKLMLDHIYGKCISLSRTSPICALEIYILASRYKISRLVEMSKLDLSIRLAQPEVIRVYGAMEVARMISRDPLVPPLDLVMSACASTLFAEVKCIKDLQAQARLVSSDPADCQTFCRLLGSDRTLSKVFTEEKKKEKEKEMELWCWRNPVAVQDGEISPSFKFSSPTDEISLSRYCTFFMGSSVEPKFKFTPPSTVLPSNTATDPSSKKTQSHSSITATSHSFKTTTTTYHSSYKATSRSSSTTVSPSVNTVISRSCNTVTPSFLTDSERLNMRLPILSSNLEARKPTFTFGFPAPTTVTDSGRKFLSLPAFSFPTVNEKDAGVPPLPSQVQKAPPIIFEEDARPSPLSSKAGKAPPVLFEKDAGLPLSSPAGKVPSPIQFEKDAGWTLTSQAWKYLSSLIEKDAGLPSSSQAGKVPPIHFEKDAGLPAQSSQAEKVPPILLEKDAGSTPLSSEVASSSKTKGFLRCKPIEQLLKADLNDNSPQSVGSQARKRSYNPVWSTNRTPYVETRVFEYTPSSWYPCDEPTCLNVKMSSLVNWKRHMRKIHNISDSVFSGHMVDGDKRYKPTGPGFQGSS